MQNNTSVEEDTELRDLVAQTLENKGILPKIRAQLRASVFCALEENTVSKDAITANSDFSAFIQLPLASVVLNLVRELLETLQLDFTLSVFDPETKYGKDYNDISKEKILKRFNLEGSSIKNPILYEIIAKILQDVGSNPSGKINGNPIQSSFVNGINTSRNDDGGLIPSSPLDLNSTYVKSTAEKNSPVNVEGIKEDIDDNYDSIDEVLPSNKSSSPERSLRDSAQGDKVENNESSAAGSSEEKSKTPDKLEIKNAAAEIDLLTFTPVKEIKTTEKTAPSNGRSLFENDSKAKQNALSVLGDLPPLNAKTESKKNQMNEIKAIIDQGLDLGKIEEDSNSPLSSKDGQNQELSGAKSSVRNDKSHNSHISEKSDKSETIDGEEFEDDDDDLSDLINSRASDNQFTVDETISKASNVGDHLESV